ncbi:MAG TPA: S53 family peptidase, partial [Gaiellales bacterium]|nr:S53 family peptidase [Gaiellales bacterium]
YRELSPPGAVHYPRDTAETQSWYVEQALDVEWAHAAAPGAHIVYVAARNDVRGLDQALAYTVDRRLADVVSSSWGAPESVLSKGEARALDSIFQQAAAEGMTMLFASGDDGDSSDWTGSPSPDLPASSPWATAVGGTSLAVGGDGRPLWQSAWGTTTTVWSGSAWSPRAPGAFIFGGGGGFSADFARPWYQAAAVPAADPAGRAIPDISLDADPETGAVFSQTYRWPDGRDQIIDSWVGGTSLSTPLMAGIAAMADQRAGAPAGLLNPDLYALAGSPAVRDVLGGHQDVAVLRNRYRADGSIATDLRSFARDSSLQAAAGWDPATGLGTPWTPALVDAVAVPADHGHGLRSSLTTP